MGSIHKILRSILIAAGAGVMANAVAGQALAADASDWSRDSRSEVRLIAGTNKSGAASMRAGIDMRLQPGWHTYWRYPGDSGVPPRFDFSGSDNLKAAKVAFPAPRLFTDETGNSIGYKDAAIFPLQVAPRDPNKPVTLRLKIDYAVCEKLCIPAEGRAELILAAGNSGLDAALAAAEAQVPKPVSDTEAGLSVHRVNNAAKPLIAVDLKAPNGKPVDIFVEGPTPEWALPIPKPAQGAAPGRAHFGFELDGLPPGVNPKGPFELTFTVVGNGRPIEVKTRLD